MDAWMAYLLIACAFLGGYVLGRIKGDSLAPPAPPDADALEAVLPILERDGEVAAIRAYRERTGASLRDAKSAVDSLHQ